MASRRTRKAVVGGAGPVGCLAALSLAKSGWIVHIYEGRPDLRLPSPNAAAQRRSINLAMSHRGIAALQAIDPAVAQRFLHAAIPMRGRMIHSESGDQTSQLYDSYGQCINSIDRSLLNKCLLEGVCASPNIRILFNHKITSVDFDGRALELRNTLNGKKITVDFDFCVGADGSFSVIRRQMMRVVRMDYSQQYIEDEYIELKIPPGRNNKGDLIFALDPNHLHIWPRHTFMLIALPNQDKSFTCTLFASSTDLDRLIHPDAVVAWFRAHFPDAIPIIGEKSLVRDVMGNPRSPLISTKSKPYHYKDCAILLGDAAHSMAPFYGQGLNCGLEDVRVLSTLFIEEHVTPDIDNASSNQFLANALSRYSQSRHDDLVAICDMAMDNYIEMRHSVTTVSFFVRKVLDNALHSLSTTRDASLASLIPVLSYVPYPPGKPGGWLPLYTMITFRPDIPYSAAKRKAIRQTNILSCICGIGAVFFGMAVVYIFRMITI